MPLADAGEAAARPAGARDRARRRQRDAQGRRARRRRDEPRHREGLRDGGSSGPDLFDRLNVVPLAHPAAARAPRRHPAARRATSSRSPRKANDRPGMPHGGRRDRRSCAYSFPGNVRELRNLIERLVILTPDDADRRRRRARVPRRAARPRSAQGLYRAGVPFRVLVEEAERADHRRRRSRTTAGRWPRRRARSISSGATSTRSARALGLRGAEKGEEDE